MPSTGFVLTLTVTMVVIHALIAAISLRHLMAPRIVGMPITAYESAYYVTPLTHALLSHYPVSLLGVITLFLAIHVVGIYLYVSGALSSLSRSCNNLRYYCYYEVVGLMFIIAVMPVLIIPQ